jgi:hypothetical protein
VRARARARSLAHRASPSTHTPFPQVVNDCGSLRAAFDCASCGDSIGGDQPAFVDRGADVPQSAGPGACLVNGDATLFSCDARYEWTRRLCPCDTGQEPEAPQ